MWMTLAMMSGGWAHDHNVVNDDICVDYNNPFDPSTCDDTITVTQTSWEDRVWECSLEEHFWPLIPCADEIGDWAVIPLPVNTGDTVVGARYTLLNEPFAFPGTTQMIACDATLDHRAVLYVFRNAIDYIELGDWPVTSTPATTDPTVQFEHIVPLFGHRMEAGDQLFLAVQMQGAISFVGLLPICEEGNLVTEGDDAITCLESCRSDLVNPPTSTDIEWVDNGGNQQPPFASTRLIDVHSPSAGALVAPAP